QSNRFLAILLILFFSITTGCTSALPWVSDRWWEAATIESVVELFDSEPDPNWQRISVDDIVALGDELKGKRVRFLSKIGPGGALGLSDIFVALVDSVHVYGQLEWTVSQNKGPDFVPSSDFKIALQKITKAEVYRDTIDAAIPGSGDPEWAPISREDLVASGDKLKGERVRFYLGTATGAELRTNALVIEHVDSAYAYCWGQAADDLPRTKMRIGLRDVTRAEIHQEQAGQRMWSRLAPLWPVALAAAIWAASQFK
ncbi:MAG: hypothetical protein V3V49_14800, partial [Candidatus Krumholzibacteria bacterium]